MVTPLSSATRKEEKELIGTVFLLCAKHFRSIAPLTPPINPMEYIPLFPPLQIRKLRPARLAKEPHFPESVTAHVWILSPGPEHFYLGQDTP